MRGGRGAFAILLALTALFLGSAPASAKDEIKMQALLNPDGTGRLFLNTGEGPFRWEACAPDLTECQNFGGGHDISTRGAPAGTVFRVEDRYEVQGTSPEWKGRLKEVAPPTVFGLIEANQFVTPVPGEWSGGWAGEGSQMQLSACATPTGDECTSLTSLHYVRRCPWSASIPIDASFVGRYLRVADHQPGAGPIVEPAYGVTSPYGAEVWSGTRSTSVAFVGQIAPATSAPAGNCGPPPAPTARISSEGVARAECGGGCRVALIGSRKGRKRRITRQIPQQDLLRPEAATEIWLSDSLLSELGAGVVRLTVEVDGRRLAQRTIHTPTS
jgi:hypothetical protein